MTTPKNTDVRQFRHVHLSPKQFIFFHRIAPAAVDLGITEDQLEALLPYMEGYPRTKFDEVVRFENQDDLLEWLRYLQGYATEKGISFAVIGLDIKNIGGLNEVYGETMVNEFIHHLIELFVRGLAELAASVEGAMYFPVHYGGGDEYLAVVLGVQEDQLIKGGARTGFRARVSAEWAAELGSANGPSANGPPTEKPRLLTGALDGIMRAAADFSRKHGLGEVPHGKKWWNLRLWGTGLAYGVTYFDPRAGERSSPETMLRDAFKLVQRFKRGMKEGESDPTLYQWSDFWQRLRCLPWCVAYKLLGVDIRFRKTRRPG